MYIVKAGVLEAVKVIRQVSAAEAQNSDRTDIVIFELTSLCPLFQHLFKAITFTVD